MTGRDPRGLRFGDDTRLGDSALPIVPSGAVGALVRRRVGIISTRFPVPGVTDIGNASVPGGTANAGKNKLPTGFGV